MKIVDKILVNKETFQTLYKQKYDLQDYQADYLYKRNAVRFILDETQEEDFKTIYKEKINA